MRVVPFFPAYNGDIAALGGEDGFGQGQPDTDVVLAGVLIVAAAIRKTQVQQRQNSWEPVSKTARPFR
jgi:hypothetical protein